MSRLVSRLYALNVTVTVRVCLSIMPRSRRPNTAARHVADVLLSGT